MSGVEGSESCPSEELSNSEGSESMRGSEGQAVGMKAGQLCECLFTACRHCTEIGKNAS